MSSSDFLASAAAGLILPRQRRKSDALSARHGLAVDPAARIEHLPIGVQQRVEILKLLYRRARVLILDEPTAVLTPQEAEGLFAVLRSLAAEGKAIVIVTHKLREVMDVSDRVTVMRAGRVVASIATKATRETELARLMVGRDVDLRAKKAPRDPGPVVLRIVDVRARDDAGYEKLRGVSLEVRAGEIVGVAGVDGNGQSQLAEATMNLQSGRERPYRTAGRRRNARDSGRASRQGPGLYSGRPARCGLCR